MVLDDVPLPIFMMVSVQCPGCGKDFLKLPEKIGSSGLSRLDLLTLADLLQKRQTLEQDMEKNIKRLEIMFKKMGDVGWIVPGMDVVKKR